MSWPKNPGYNQGAFKQICDICGFIYLNTQTRKRWDGMVCCDKCWDPRHPQDLLQVPRDDQSVPDPRPEQPDHFVDDGTTWIKT
jgi:hypothetical protein